MSAIQDMKREEVNRQFLVATVNRVKGLLERQINRSGDRTDHDDEQVSKIREGMISSPPLDVLCSVFKLSPFERDLLVMCAGVELDSSFADTLGKTGVTYPTFGLALASLPEAHWSALSPGAPLRYWRMIEIIGPQNLTDSRLKIDESILHYLAGLGYFDERLTGYIRPMLSSGVLVPSHKDIVERAIAICERDASTAPRSVFQFCGTDSSSQHAIASSVCEGLDMNLSIMNSQAIPHEPRELEALERLWERQAAITRSALLLDCADSENEDRAAETAIVKFMEETRSFLILCGRERRSLIDRPVISFEVMKPTPIEQLEYWRQLSEKHESVNGKLESIVSQFNLNTGAIESIYNEAAKLEESRKDQDLETVLWETCRMETRHRLDALARRIHSNAAWDDLVLPESVRQTLTEITAQVRQRLAVYVSWGFGRRISRGLGIAALFVGPSGTGKTMAAEILANELHLDLYRIDLSQVVSKYIGETEKNLRRVFDAAEEGGAILLFDEADALFGKRSEVKDSHDRYANIEISYLLQRMEDYRGLAILTTNMKEAIDTAFLRRLRFVVQFPFPGFEQRKEIWRGIFPGETPTQDLDVDKLAKLNVSGGNIRNIAVHAAFLAADSNQPVCMSHLLRAAKVEYAKLETSLTDAEIKGWV